MHNNRGLGWAVLVLLPAILLACAGTDVPMPDSRTNPSLDLLLDVDARVSLKREAWASYAPVSFGAAVQRGDLVRPEDGQSVRVLCADLSVQSVTQEQGNPCEPREPVLMYNGSLLLSLRAAGVRTPYILYPRGTTVLDPRPLLRWKDTGDGPYTITIHRGASTVWEQSGVQSAKFRYPDSAPALEPNVDYLLAVTAESTEQSSRDDPAKGLGFRVLTADQHTAIETRAGEILALPLEQPATQFVLAIYYAGQGLLGDAAEILDELALTVDAPAVHLWRGDLYAAMQLPGEAREAYQAAFDSARKTGDLEGQAEAQIGLWRVTKDSAVRDAAVESYKALGDGAVPDDLRPDAE